MKRTKQKDTRNCDYCKKDGVLKKAAWKDDGHYACEEHKDEIPIDDGHMSEGDYQSWGRL